MRIDCGLFMIEKNCVMSGDIRTRASTRLNEAKNEIVGLHIGSLGYCLKDLELTRSEI